MVNFTVSFMVLILGTASISFAQTGESSTNEFYNRDSSGYSYRIGPVPPRIERDWELGALPSEFTIGLNPSGIDVQNYVRSLLNLPSVSAALQEYTGTQLYNDFLLRSFQNPNSASALANVTSLMNQQLTIRMLQDVLRRLQLGPDPAASIQAGSQERCVQLAVTFGIMSVESAEKACAGGPGGNARGIMVFGTASTTEKIVGASQMSPEDKQLLKDLVIDFRTSSVSGGRQDVRRVIPAKSVSDARAELEDKICQEVREKVRQASSGARAGGPLSVEGTIPLTADVLFSLARMEPSMREVSVQSICRRQSLIATRAKILRLSQRFSQALEGVSSNHDVPQVVREEYRVSLQRLLTDVDLMAKQAEFEDRVARDILATATEQRRVEGKSAGSADLKTRAGLESGWSLEYGTGK